MLTAINASDRIGQPPFLWRFLMNFPNDRCNSIPTVSLHSRRGIIAALASASVLPPGVSVAASGASAEDERFMRVALDEAGKLILRSLP
jgi:hypothetical protein